MKKIVIVSVVLFSFHVSAQKIGVDSKGKSIFTHFSRSEARLEFSTEEPLSLSYFLWTKNINHVLTNSGVTTVTKFSGFFGQLSMLNSTETLDLSNLADIHPGLGMKFGYQKSIENFTNIDLIPRNYKSVYTCGINGIFNIDNVQLYNSDSLREEKKYPLTYGIEGNLNFFFRNKGESTSRVVLAINTSLLQSWNSDDLLNYQKISEVTVLPDIITLKDFKGSYGVINQNITKFRLAISSPMYFSVFNPIPYIVLNSTYKSYPKWNLGIFLNILTKSLPKQNFKIPTSLGIGIDWIYSADKFSKPNIFIKGAISFGK